MKELLMPLPQKQQQRLDQVYTRLDANSTATVEGQTNLLIDDIGLGMADQSWLRSQIKKGLVLLNPDDLTPFVQQRVDKLPDGTLLVFPKNGALQVRKRLNLGDAQNISVCIKRNPDDLMLGRLVVDSQLLLDTITDLKPERVTVIDDVIARGATVTEIRKVAQSAMQTLSWSAVCWLMQFPDKLNKNSSGVAGFEQTQTSLLYFGENGRLTPLNSLSTWLYDQEKGPLIAQNYAQKYAIDPDGFIDVIQQLSVKYPEAL